MSKDIIMRFQGTDVRFKEDGWFNATEVAKKRDKRPGDWLAQRDVVEYMAALAKRLGKSEFVQQFNEIKDLQNPSASSRAKLLRLAKEIGFVRIKAGSPANGGGTWMHPKLAVRFAQWLDADFAVWCDEQVDLLLRGEAPYTTDDPSELSTVRDRFALYHFVIDTVLRHHLLFSNVYGFLNAFAGARRFKGMTKKQVKETIEFTNRFATGRETRSDWQRIQANQAKLFGEPQQIDFVSMLLSGPPRLGDPLDPSSIKADARKLPAGRGVAS